MIRIQISVLVLLIAPLCNAGKNDPFLQKEKEYAKRIYQLIGPKLKKTSKVPLFSGNYEGRTKNIIKQSNITPYLQPKYAEKEPEEAFLANYRPTNGGTLLIDIILNNGETTDIEKELARGADVNAADRDGNTALHHLLSKKTKRTREKKKKANFSLISKLLEAGANIHAPNKQGETPLGIAEERNLPQFVVKMKTYDQKV